MDTLLESISSISGPLLAILGVLFGYSVATRTHQSNQRYEREMEVYRKIWPILFELKEKTCDLRPVATFEFVDPNETEEQKKAKQNAKAQKYAEQLTEFIQAHQYNRPFYPPEIWNEFQNFKQLCVGEAVEWRFKSDTTRWDVVERAIKNQEAISKAVDRLADIIRERLASFK